MSWKPPNKYANLYENPLIKEWLVTYTAPNTKREHLKRFGRLLEGIGYTPERIVDEIKAGNGRALKTKVKEFCANLVDRGLTASANLTLSSFRSFIIAHELSIPWSRQDIITIVAVRVDRRVPKKEEIYRIIAGLDAGTGRGKERNLRYKAMIWTAFQTGLRPSPLLRLRIHHIPLDQEPPIPIKVTPQLDPKIKRPLAKIGFYWTFLGKEAQTAIQQYLRLRETYGEKLTSESPLFENFHQRGKQIDLSAWDDIVRGLGKLGGFKPGEISPHSFRHAFRKHVRYFVDDQVGTVLTGHKIKGSEEAYFDRKDMEFLRAEYGKVNWTLEKQIPQREVQQLSDQIHQIETEKEQYKDEVKRLSAGLGVVLKRLEDMYGPTVTTSDEDLERARLQIKEAKKGGKQK